MNTALNTNTQTIPLKTRHDYSHSKTKHIAKHYEVLITHPYHSSQPLQNTRENTTAV